MRSLGGQSMLTYVTTPSADAQEGALWLVAEGQEKVLVADEENFTNSLLKVIREGKKVVYFLEGHAEHSINNTEREGYSEAKRAIESQNYVVKGLNLLTEGKLPDDASIHSCLIPPR